MTLAQASTLWLIITMGGIIVLATSSLACWRARVVHRRAERESRLMVRDELRELERWRSDHIVNWDPDE